MRGRAGCALEARLAEEGFDRFAVRVRGGRAHACKRQVRELVCERLDQAANLFLLLRVELVQLLGQRAIGFGRGDAFEGAA